MSKERLYIFDTTLRDGAQTQGVHFSLDEKTKIAHALDELVRFWYSALYLFASAYALMHEGHVRVDVLYTGFSERKKAWTNSLGSLLLGIPLCLIVLFLGMGGKASIINGPVISFEITQQGSNGLYLLYLMAVYLAVFAVTMLTQFTSYFMSSNYILLKK